MMGLRGIRLGIVYPDIMKMQVRAIFEAACEATKNGIVAKPEVMIPLTGHVNELKVVQPTLEEIAKQVMAEKGVQVAYKFGTMIEIPRAAVTASEIASMVSENRKLSWGTIPKADRSSRNPYDHISILPINTWPSPGSSILGRIFNSVLLPDPTFPRIPNIEPSGM